MPTPRPARRAAVSAALLLATAGAAPSPAQPPGGGRGGPYERALRLVESGRGAEGRALTDSLVAAAGPRSPALAEALWWRAALAADAASAERDLRRVLGEVPESPRVGPAAVRLAQLALLRDRPDEAATLLDPFARGRAGDPVRPLAGYWLARARLERRDAAGACAALDGVTSAPVLDADLARQVAALRRRVPGCGGAAVAVGPTPGTPAPAVAAPAASPPAPPGANTPAPGAPAVGAPAGRAPGSGPAGTSPVGTSPGGTSQAATSSAPPPAATSASPNAAPSSAPSTAPATGAGPTAPAAPPAAPPPRAAAAAPNSAPGTPPAGPATTSPRPAPARGPVYAVQLAAYDRRRDAEALVARLRAGGLDAFADGEGAAGDAPPFRVKAGRYATRAAAAAALTELRGRGLAGFVTTARPAAPAAAP